MFFSLSSCGLSWFTLYASTQIALQALVQEYSRVLSGRTNIIFHEVTSQGKGGLTGLMDPSPKGGAFLG